MVDKICLKKGLTINLKGAAEKRLGGDKKSAVYAVVPDDFDGFEPKLCVKVGDRVLAGSALLFDKNQPSVKIASPVSGEVVAINRGERRKILSIEVKADAMVEYLDFGEKSVSAMTAVEVKQAILEAGLWWTIKQRPFDVVALVESTPRDIFVTGFDSAPLAPESEYALADDTAALQAGFDALAKMTSGKVVLSVRGNSRFSFKGVHTVNVCGEHPAGNVGVQLNAIAPINKGETVWTLSIFDLIFIGRLFVEGKVNMTRIIAVAGSEVVSPYYIKVVAGTAIESILKGNIAKPESTKRIINGNVLSGRRTAMNGYLSLSAHQISVIPEGADCHDLLGWGTPGLGKFSVSRSFFSWLCPKKEYVIDARIRGGERGIIVSGLYESVFPMDVLPEQLIKATLAFEIEKMENLGIYEVAPEDFALCEFVDVSKLEIQHIIRTGLDKLKKEVM